MHFYHCPIRWKIEARMPTLFLLGISLGWPFGPVPHSVLCFFKHVCYEVLLVNTSVDGSGEGKMGREGDGSRKTYDGIVDSRTQVPRYHAVDIEL